MLLLSIITIGSLGLILPTMSGEVHKKIIIHVPLEVHEKHHTHTVFKHVYHKEKEHKHEPKNERFTGYNYGKGKKTWQEEEKLWKKEVPKWQEWNEPQKPIATHIKPKAKNPHRISSYIPNYNHEKKREEIFENDFGGFHKHKRGHSFTGDYDNGEESFGYGRSLLDEKKKGSDLAIHKVISHTVYHD